MTDPVVSIVLPVYNADEYIGHSIDSLLNQTFEDFEIVAINDGSTDQSASVLQQYKDPRLKIFHNSENLGLISTLNKGIELARGKYIARIDADDCALSHRLETQVRLLEKDPGTVLVFSARTAIDNDGNKVSTHNLVVSGDELIRWKLLTGNFITHSSVIFRAEAIPIPLFNHQYLYAEDYAAWLLLLSKGKFDSIKEPLVQYRFHGASVSAKHREIQVNSAMTALQTYLLTEYNAEFSINSLRLWSCPEDVDNEVKQADFMALLNWMHPMNNHFKHFSGYRTRVRALYHYYRRLTFLLLKYRTSSDRILDIVKAFFSSPLVRNTTGRNDNRTRLGS